MQLPPLVTHPPLRGIGRPSLGGGRGHAHAFTAYGVPTSDWEGAKKKFFQSGGLSGSEQIAAFLSGLSNTDMLPHSIRRWLTTLCEEEGAHLLKMLELHKGGTASGGLKGKPSSLSARKFASFRANREPQGSSLAKDGDGARVTPRGSFRLTPRRTSQGVTPLEEPLGGAMDPMMDAVAANVAALGPMRLSFDFTNVSVLEQTVANVLSHRAICALPQSASLHGLQAVANGKPTYDPVRDSGAMTLEQLALLLSFIAAPQIFGPDHRQRASGNEEATASFLSLLHPDAQDGSSDRTSSAAAGLKLEALLDDLGMPTKQIMDMMAGGTTEGVRELGLEDDAPLMFVGLGGGDFRVGLDQLLSSADDAGTMDQDDVLARLTPPRRQGSMLRHSESIMTRSRRASSVTDLCPGSRSSDVRSSSAIPVTQHAVSFQSGGPGLNPTSTPRRTPRLEMSFSGSDSLSVRHEEPAQIISGRRTGEPLALPPTPLQAEVQSPVVCAAHSLPAVSLGTQTDARSFTLLWLGPKVRDVGTSSRPSGDVGRVVSLQLLKAARRKRAHPKAAGESYEELCKLPVEELERRYQASVEQMKAKSQRKKKQVALVQ